MTLVFIPGHMCGPWLYAPQLAAFPDAVIADVTQDDTVQGMAARLLEDHASPLTLVGLSLGGMIAMEAMAMAPDRIRGACLMATDPTSAREQEITWRRGLVGEGLDSYRKTFVRQFFRHDEAVAATLGPATLDHMAQTPDNVTRAQVAALDTRSDMLPRITEYPGPVEIVAGEADRVCPAKLHRPIADALPDARLTVLEHTGHILTLETPDASVHAVQRLLERLEP